MYYSNITNKELQEFHKVFVPNFSIKLTDALTSRLFRVDTIISDSIYKIYPLFYTNEITSSNPNDNILDNQCIICEKLTKPTYLTFISDADEDIKDYSNYATYFTVGDSLTTSQFNSIVSLLRHNTIHNDTIRINDSIIGKYGTYEFDLTETTILDNGIVITDETILAEPKVKLTSPSFINSTYTLKLSVLHYTDVNVLDDETDDYKVVDTLEIELTPNEWVDIPVTDLEDGYIILFDAEVEIRHDKTIIQNWITHILLTGDKSIIQSGDTLNLTAYALDDMENGVDGKDIYFVQKFEPLSLNLTSPNPIFQSGEKSNIQAKIVEADGQIMDDYRIDFYEIYTPSLSLGCLNPIIQTGEKANLQAKLKDEDGSLVKGVRVDFYEVYEPTTIRLTSDKSIIQSGDVANLSATLKDSDGSLISGETIYFYEKIEE